MRSIFITLLLLFFGASYADSVEPNNLEQPQSNATQTAEGRKPNWVIPILGGALFGIGLAWWLRRKKNG